MAGRPTAAATDRVGFVLSGGGPFGATQVGMLRALLEHDISPDLILGTSVGSVNGVAMAAEPSSAAVERLAATWQAGESSGLFGGSVFARVGTLARTRTHLHGDEVLRQTLVETLPVDGSRSTRCRSGGAGSVGDAPEASVARPCAAPSARA